MSFVTCARSMKTAIKQCTNADAKHMKAWRIHSYGDINELQLMNARNPYITSPTELLVKVEASSLNPIDDLMINGYAKTVARFFRGGENIEFPLTLGRDFSGVILDKGQNVHDFQVGDQVYGVLPIHKQGSHAEIVVAESSLTCHKPPHLSPMEASSIMYAALTAWSALFLSGEVCLRNPKRVLIVGASGGVGTLAVQMLAASGVTVVAVCSKDAMPLVQQMGAQHVFDYRDPQYEENIATNGQFDFILDCANIGIEKIPSSWKYSKYITLNSPVVKNTDKYGVLGGLVASTNDYISNSCFTRKSLRWAYFAPFPSGVKYVHELVSSKKLRPVIHKVFPFQDLPAAFECLRAGNMRGKIVLEVG